jgi:hypothetical protein
MTAPESAQARDFLAKRYVALVAKLTAVEALCDEAESRTRFIAKDSADARLTLALVENIREALR